MHSAHEARHSPVWLWKAAAAAAAGAVALTCSGDGVIVDGTDPVVDVTVAFIDATDGCDMEEENCDELVPVGKDGACRPIELNCWPVNCLRRRARRFENHT